MLQITWGNCGLFRVNFTPTKCLKIMFRLTSLNFRMRKD
ncbi:hypothetical protein Golob_007188 [Gossypium lobatum]|uniref:Uncharacterized protein n=1 Tax=Gossypium lobatum TaxID=34289 RepID=A0A7J8MBV4_9ROSI|nr:hypothetical protein [Gossypium lobatum]